MPRESHADGPDPYRAIFDAAPIGLGVADLDGRLLVFNRAIMEPGGYERADIEAIGNVARLYYRDADRDRALALAREQGFLWRHEVQFRRKDGTPYDTLLSLAPLQFEGRRCWLAAVEDVTEQKRAEARQQELQGQLMQAQKMEAVGRMTAGIAHDFNNVLSVISGSAQMIGAILGPAAGAANDDLVELRRATDRGVAMVRKLLGYSRRAALTLKPTDLSALLEDLQGMLRRLVPEPIALAVRGAPGCIAEVDALAVEQIVVNLVTNARDAIRETGTVAVAVEPAVVHEGGAPAWLPPGAYIRLTVVDTGQGMDEATRARVFEPFFTTKPAGAGTGLGMAMVFGLTKQQGGYADVASELGRGTTVTVYLRQARPG